MGKGRTMLTGVKGVVFDLDDTLYPEEQFVFSGFAAVGRLLQERFGLDHDPAARCRTLYESSDRGRVFDRLVEELRLPASDSLVPELIACYRNHRPEISLFADAEEVLSAWRGRLPMGLISDGYFETQSAKVDALGLVARLDPILLTGQWGRAFWKPHPRAFEEIQRVWGCQGPECVYIADNPAKDFGGPRRLGWQTVRVRRQGGVYAEAEAAEGGQPDQTVETLTDIDISF
jgi:putative hydrolase of the HAD superfamily